MRIKKNNDLRISSSFPETVEFETSEEYENAVTFGFVAINPDDPTKSGSGKTNEVWTLGAIKGGEYSSSDGGIGVRIQYQKKQKICVGTLSGNLALFANGDGGRAGRHGRIRQRR